MTSKLLSFLFIQTITLVFKFKIQIPFFNHFSQYLGRFADLFVNIFQFSQVYLRIFFLSFIPFFDFHTVTKISLNEDR